MRKRPERELLDLAKLGFRDVIMVGRYAYDRIHPPLRAHVHQQVFEICLLEEGSQTYFVGADRFVLKSGDLLMTKPGEVHGTGGEPENKGRLYWVELRRGDRNNSILGLDSADSRLFLQRLLALSPRCHQGAGHLIPILEQFFHVYHDPDRPLRVAELRNLLLRFFFDVLALAERPVPQLVEPGIKLALAYIDNHLQTQLSIPALAKVACFSESHFKKQFKEQTGLPPMEFAQRRRIEWGKRLLRSHRYSVTRVAMDLGFTTTQHFATTFKRLTGLTPREYGRFDPTTPPVEHPQSGAGVGFHPVVHLDEKPRKKPARLQKHTP